MRLGLKLATASALSLALFSGDLASLSFAPAAAEARSYRHYGHGHYGRPVYYGHRGYYRHRSGISAGEAIAGVAIVGGIAAIASAASRDRQYRDGYYGRSDQPAYSYDRYGYPDRRTSDRSAGGDPVDSCSRIAEVEAQRSGGFARIAGISRVTDRRAGVEVEGIVETHYPDGERRDSTERFVCTADTGGVRDFRFVG